MVMAYFNSFVFFSLSLLHFYWLLGGKMGMSAVIPTTAKPGDKIFVPSAFSTVVVAVGLLLFGLVELGNTNVFSNWLELKYFRWGNLMIAFIFLARAVGDFNYVGFFKRKRDTVFARNDTRYYSPLCLFISVTSAFISLN
jgi:Protein of unknown function (DUF3995)